MGEEKKKQKQYVAIDLKSFYASVECVERGLDPMTTNLVVADPSRTSKTICLAVSPSLKAYGIPGRARLFEVEQRVKEVNASRKAKNGQKDFHGDSYSSVSLQLDPGLELSYLVAPPKMAKYMEISAKIYQIYLHYLAPEDIHVYSIDEVFMDVTDYLFTYQMTAQELAMTMIKDVLNTTGITATAGIGTNLYLAKIAMDIVAKHIPANQDGVRIASLDEHSYRKQLWTHEPITDFWRVGRGYANKLAKHGLYTMGDVARCSIGAEGEFYNEDLLYRLFGVNAQLLIDHAWGWEPCTISQIKGYQPKDQCINSGQVLSSPYPYDKARIVVKEMAQLLALDLTEKSVVTDQVVLTIGYDVENLTNETIRKKYRGEITVDGYGRKVPKHAHGTENLSQATDSASQIAQAVMTLYDRIINKDLLIRRVTISANHIKSATLAKKEETYEQMDLFSDFLAKEDDKEQKEQNAKKEQDLQKAMLSIQHRFGKNAILKGTNLQEGATTIERNQQIGGHKA